ncbi:MAG: acylphosphatase [Verrucomicrobia bacterium]|nr:acylphosphatase [Verrucomicrobiota bacterium]
MLKRSHVIYTGRVQGVGFRYTVRQLAHGFDVVGYVRNLDDGRVEMVIEGEEEELNRFIKHVGSSDLAPYIRHESIESQTPTGEFRSFSIQL